MEKYLGVTEAPWLQTAAANRQIWTEKAESCDHGVEPSGAAQDILPPRVFRRNNMEINGGQEEEEEEIVGDDEEPVRVSVIFIIFLIPPVRLR